MHYEADFEIATEVPAFERRWAFREGACRRLRSECINCCPGGDTLPTHTAAADVMSALNPPIESAGKPRPL
jgi:hypothetical protein